MQQHYNILVKCTPGVMLQIIFRHFIGPHISSIRLWPGNVALCARYNLMNVLTICQKLNISTECTSFNRSSFLHSQSNISNIFCKRVSKDHIAQITKTKGVFAICKIGHVYFSQWVFWYFLDRKWLFYCSNYYDY